MTDLFSLLGYREVAERAGVTEAAVRGYRRRKQMPEPTEVVMGHPLWDPAVIDTWLANRPGRGRWGERKL